MTAEWLSRIPFIISHQDSVPQRVERSDVFEIFPIKIGSYIFTHEHKTCLKQLCFDIIDKYRNNSEYSIQSNGYLTHYFDPIISINSSLLDYPGFETFHTWIKRCSIDYINNTLGCDCGDDVVITQCWINECSKGGSQTPHTHKNSLISGTYFVNFIPAMHAPLTFIKPTMAGTPYLELERNNTTCSNDSETSVKPYEGALLLWESHLVHAHSSLSNNADKRISISFNVMPKTLPGIYGFKLIKI
jgi:uncharacterized protein (TIGR02466 family)